MDALNTYLNPAPRPHPHHLGLVLPRIPERPLQAPLRTAPKTRPKRKSSNQRHFVSETTLSPEQEYIHDQIKITLGCHKELK